MNAFSFVGFLPCALCLVWAIFYVVNKHKYTYYPLFSLIALLLSIFFFMQALFVGGLMDYRELVWHDLVFTAVSLAFFPFVMAVFHKLERIQNGLVFTSVSVSVTSVLVSMLLAVVLLLGIPDASGLVQIQHDSGIFALYGIHRNATNLLSILYLCVYVAIASWLVYSIIDTIHMHKKSQGGGFEVPDRLLRFMIAAMVVVCVCFYVPAGVLAKYHWLCVLLSLLASACLFAVFCGVDRIFTISRRDQTVTVEPDEDEVGLVTEGPVISPDLVKRFEQYMTKDKPYLNPDLSLEVVASALGTNRTYVSSLVNQYYGMTFRMYINILRIEEAKKIMIANPRILVADVAERSGFSGVSQFVRKFKEISGEPPKIWSSAKAQDEES